MSKSTIPGICAIVNEQITAHEDALTEVVNEREAIEAEFYAKIEKNDVEQRDLRQYITRLQTTVTTLQNLQETL